MAIDTHDKRLSLLDMGAVGPSMLPEPDGSLGVGDRYHLLGQYRSDAAEDEGGGGGGGGAAPWIHRARRRGRR